MKNDKEKPEVYALRQDNGTWQFSRRDFLKAAGIGAAAIGAGLSSGCSPKEDLVQVTPTPTSPPSIEDLCKNAPAHERSTIQNICLSVDDRYLISGAYGTLKCWDLETYALLGSLFHSPLRDSDIFDTGRIDGKSCVFGNGNGVDYIQYFELPFTNDSEKQTSPIKGTFLRDMLLDSSGNFYGMNNEGIYYSAAADGYASTELFYELEYSNYQKSIQLIDDERKLFIQFRESGSYGVLDLSTKMVKLFDGNCDRYGVSPDGTQALIFDAENDVLQLVSLSDGSVIWKTAGKDTGFAKTNGKRIKGIAISADGKDAFLVGDLSSSKGGLKQISMADGSLKNAMNLGKINNLTTPMALTKDGTKLVLSYSQVILVISLPDLKVIGCLTDISAMPDTMQGIEVSQTDSVSGAVYTYTLPEGAEIPAGSVCTCNTVAGRISTGCTCDSYTCSCDAHRSGGGSHYWHPN